MNEWRVLVLFVGMALAFVAGTRWDAAKVATAEGKLTAYKLQISQQAEQQKREQLEKRAADDAAVQQREKAHANTLENLQLENDRLADRLRTERVRRICTTSTAAVPATRESVGGITDTPAGAGQLSEAAGIDLLRLARDADKIVEAARACQGDLKTAGATP